MTCCQPDSFDAVFSEKRASKDLKRYRKKGPDKTTRLLLDALKADGVAGKTLLDIGGGIGVAHHELLAAGDRSRNPTRRALAAVSEGYAHLAGRRIRATARRHETNAERAVTSEHDADRRLADRCDRAPKLLAARCWALHRPASR